MNAQLIWGRPAPFVDVLHDCREDKRTNSRKFFFALKKQCSSLEVIRVHWVKIEPLKGTDLL